MPDIPYWFHTNSTVQGYNWLQFRQKSASFTHNTPTSGFISGFRFAVNAICTLLGYNTAYGGNSYPTFRDNLFDIATLEDWTVRSSRNVGKELPPYAALCPRRAQIPCKSHSTVHVRVIRRNSHGLLANRRSIACGHKVAAAVGNTGRCKSALSCWQ